ncbi:MAG: amidohydrolase family protein, partial [Pseudomonadota bacterium]
ETDVDDYRTFFKVKPPLRSEDDRTSVVEAVRTGTIDIISSMHTPQDEESKRLPFEEAASGAVGLETLICAAIGLYHRDELDLNTLFRAMAFNPARRLGLDCGRLAKGAPADLVLFDPDASFILDRTQLKSRSKNTPFDGVEMRGKVLKTLVAGKIVFEAENA